MNESLQTFGSYRLIEPLGEGAMGSVWKAMDLRLERVVALKLLKDADEARRRAMLIEAKTACQLHHPNIATIFEAGEVDGTTFIAMEFVEGHTLRAFVRERNEADWLMKAARQTCGALGHAHQKGIVHRDIKPENLVITGDGAIKILDFGIARRHGAEPAAAPSGATAGGLPTGHHATLVERTAPGYSQGTPAYMSPEQANGYEVGPASDQFSLGVVLYELATGHHPFLRSSLVETLFAVVKDEPASLREARPDLPPGLVAAVERLMAKLPANRFPSMQDALVALDAPEAMPTLRAPVLPPPRASWARIAVFGGLIAILAAGGMYALLRRESTGLAAARAASSTDFAKGRKAVAVMPLEQLMPDPERAWISTSFADAMASSLVARNDVMVVDRARVLEAMRALGGQPGQAFSGVSELGKALQVDQLVTGTYLIVGDRVRLGVRVLESSSGALVQQFNVEKPLAEILDMEDELRTRLPREMGLGEGSTFQSKARDPRTREAYAKGDAYLTQGNLDAFLQAKRYFEEALKTEPGYAPAHAGLAWAQSEIASDRSLGQGRFAEAQKLFKEGEAHARKSIGLDPAYPQAYRALSAILMRTGNLDGACQAALQAIRLDPGNSLAYNVLGDAFAGLEGEENHAASRRYFEKALQLDPNSWQAHHRFAVLLQNDGALAESVEHARRAIALKPTAEYVYVTGADALIWAGKAAEADAMVKNGLEMIPGSNVLRSLQAYGAALRGETAVVEELAQGLKGAWAPDHSSSVLLAGLAPAGRKDLAGTAAIYLPFAQRQTGVDWSRKLHNERRVMSVNLYFMARTLAALGGRTEAQTLLDLADRLHPGKRRVAAQDPAFRG
ncbi:MAG: protein kinase [Holophagaceae bacterium]|nr:protein kinase [Holophagaceae bacterium]